MNSQGERALAMANPKRDGPNWVVLAGGAIVMAVGIVIGRKQVQWQGEQPRIVKAELESPLSDSRLALREGARDSHGIVYGSESPGVELFDDNMSIDGNGNGSPLSWKTPRASPRGDDSGTLVAFQPQSEAKRRSQMEPSQPASKLCRRLKDDSDEFQAGESYCSPALRAGLAARHAMVQKLRNQVRKRDGIIFDLQARVSDQDQVITMHRVHIADLHERLKLANVEYHHELQKMREEMRIQNVKLLTCNAEDWKGRDIFDGGVKPVGPDLKAILVEARMLCEKVKRLQGEKAHMESQVQTFSRECELLFRKATALETERVQLKRLLNEKGQLLQAKEEEFTKLSNAFMNLHDNFEARDRESDCTRSSKVSGLSDALSENIGGAWSDGFDQPISCNTPDDYYSKTANIIDANNRYAGDLMRSYNSLFRQSPSPLDSDGSASKLGSRGTAHGCASKSACDGSPNYDRTDFDNDESVNLSLVWSLQREVHELSDVLAKRSKAVLQRKLQTSRVLTEFQATQTTTLCGPEDYDWDDLSQVLSFAPDGTSAERLQELSHSLEKIAKQQQVEDEIEALSTHQDQIRALKSRLATLTSKFNGENIRLDELSNDSVHGVAGMLLDLADKLDAQEDQVRETIMDIQQLSMSLQLSSPYVPRSKKQELQRMLQGGSRQADVPVLERVHRKDIPITPDQPAHRSYFEPEQKVDSRSCRSLDRQISFSSLPTKTGAFLTPPSEGPPGKVYEFKVGTFDPLSSAKLRKSTSHGTGKSSLRKPQSASHGLKWDAGSTEKPSGQVGTRRVCFSPDEVTSVFSFRPSPTKADKNSDNFQWTPEAQEGSDPAISTGVSSCCAGTRYSQSNYISLSEPTSRTHGLFLQSSRLSQTPDGQFTSAFGSVTGSGSCSESKDSLRRYLFRTDSGTSHGENPLYDGDNSHEETTAALEKLCLTGERKNDFLTDDEVQIKRLTVENASTKLGMHSGFAGLSPFAARVAYEDVKRSTSSFNSPNDCDVGKQGVSSVAQAEGGDYWKRNYVFE